MLIFFTVFTILFTWLAIKRLDWAVQFLIFALPAYLIRVKVVVPITLLEVMIWVVFLVWAYHTKSDLKTNLKQAFSQEIKTGQAKVDYPFKWELIALLIISFISAAVSDFSFGALGVWKAYFFEPVLLFIVVLNVIGKEQIPLEQKFKKIIWPLVLSALAISIFSIFQKFTGLFIPNPLWAAATTRRVTAVFGYPNAVGLYLEGIILLMTGYLFFVIQSGAKRNEESLILDSSKNRLLKILHFVQDDKIKKGLLVVIIILSLLSILFAKSVGASLGVVAGLIIFLFLINKKVRLVTLGVLLVCAIGISAVSPIRHQALKYLTLNDFSGQVRRSQWRETVTMLQDKNHWLLGAGLDNYQAAIRPYHQPGFFVENYDDPNSHRKLVFDPVYKAAHWQPLEIFMYPHNILLNFWTEVGLFGMLLFVWLIIKSVYLGFKNLNSPYRPLAAGLISIMTAIVIHGLVDVPYFKNDLSVMFWLWLALICMIDLHGKKIIS